MHDINGAVILEKTKLYSHHFGKAGPEMKCFGYLETDGRIILGQDKVGEIPIYLTQEQLLTTHTWVVYPDFKPKKDAALPVELLDAYQSLQADFDNLTMAVAIYCREDGPARDEEFKLDKDAVDWFVGNYIEIDKDHPDAELIAEENATGCHDNKPAVHVLEDILRINELGSKLRDIRNAALPDPNDEREISLDWLINLIMEKTQVQHSISIEEEGDEIFYLPTKCTQFACIKTGMNIDLKQDEFRDWLCPICHYSYGQE